jgi:hypothetical protein
VAQQHAERIFDKREIPRVYGQKIRSRRFVFRFPEFSVRRLNVGVGRRSNREIDDRFRNGTGRGRRRLVWHQNRSGAKHPADDLQRPTAVDWRRHSVFIGPGIFDDGGDDVVC